MLSFGRALSSKAVSMQLVGCFAGEAVQIDWFDGSKRGISPAAKRLSSACQLAQTHAAKVRSNGAASARDTDAKPVLTTAVKMHPVTTKVVGCHCGQRPVDDSRRRRRTRGLKAARLSGFSWPTKILLGQPRHFWRCIIAPRRKRNFVDRASGIAQPRPKTVVGQALGGPSRPVTPRDSRKPGPGPDAPASRPLSG